MAALVEQVRASRPWHPSLVEGPSGRVLTYGAKSGAVGSQSPDLWTFIDAWHDAVLDEDLMKTVCSAPDVNETRCSWMGLVEQHVIRISELSTIYGISSGQTAELGPDCVSGAGGV